MPPCTLILGGVVDFSDAPKIKYDASSPAEVTVQEGERVELTCTFTGEPTPSITWLRGDDKKGVDGIFHQKGCVFVHTLHCVVNLELLRITNNPIFCEWINKTQPFIA